MCGKKLIDKNNTKELMQMLGVTVPIEKMVRAAAFFMTGCFQICGVRYLDTH